MQQMRTALKAQGMVVHPLKTRAPYLRSYGFDADVVFDIGVGVGTPWLYRSFPAARFVLIDPQPDCAEHVREKGHLDDFHFHAVALGHTPGAANLNVPYSSRRRESSMASLKKRTDKLADSFVRLECQEVPVKRLDDIAVAYSGRVGLKLDTEGSELDVLQGATETLQRSDFVLLEMSVTPRFDGVGLPSQIVALLSEAGLQIRDVVSFGAGPGKKARPRYMDVLFARWTTT